MTAKAAAPKVNQVAGSAIEIPVELIHRSKTNPVSRGLQGLDELRASIRANGIRVPLQVFKDSKGYELDDGEGRWTIAKELKLKTVPCIIVKKPGSTALDQLIKGSTQRKLSPWEQAQLIGNCLGEKIKQKEIADAVGKSEGWVSKFKTIHEAAKKAPTMSSGGSNGPQPYVTRRDGGFKEYFFRYTSMDELYDDCQVMLNPAKPEKPASSSSSAAPPPAGDGHKQQDLVTAVQRQQLEEIEAEIAAMLEVTVDQVKAELDGAGAVHLVVRLSDLKAAQKAVGLEAAKK